MDADVGDAFNSPAIGEPFAGPVAVSVANALLLAQAERLVVQLQGTLSCWGEIDQATGVVMSRSGLTCGDAFARLQVSSDGRGVEVCVVARELLTQARATALARHPDTSRQDGASPV